MSKTHEALAAETYFDPLDLALDELRELPRWRWLRRRSLTRFVVAELRSRGIRSLFA